MGLIHGTIVVWSPRAKDTTHYAWFRSHIHHRRDGGFVSNELLQGNVT